MEIFISFPCHLSVSAFFIPIYVTNQPFQILSIFPLGFHICVLQLLNKDGAYRLLVWIYCLATYNFISLGRHLTQLKGRQVYNNFQTVIYIYQRQFLIFITN